ncbi:hypothetical protein [Allofranklinella schreckenbergeri]|uniref:hypothetical protein n=1 Tax=Allofranklinella schreckenbergeri TaxID=1076744 RepID=UPI0011C45401|nr:hypothetical protein [Allofranklinella schreckenbergeri]
MVKKSPRRKAGWAVRGDKNKKGAILERVQSLGASGQEAVWDGRQGAEIANRVFPDPQTTQKRLCSIYIDIRVVTLLLMRVDAMPFMNAPLQAKSFRLFWLLSSLTRPRLFASPVFLCPLPACADQP